MADGAVHIPNMTPFEALSIDVDDLLTEAKNWADGTAAETQEQVDEIARLIDELNDRAKLLDAERVKEKKPLDEQIDAIQTRFNVYIAPIKNKTPGKIPVAIDALNAAKRPFLIALEKALEEKREAARKEAQRLADEAAKAAQEAAANDLGAREDAEAKVAEAEAAASAAKAADKERAHAHGSGRAQGLRTRVVAEVTDMPAAVAFYWKDRRSDFVALIERLAAEDARVNRRIADGVTFREERY